jgi:hypothetical protein
MEVSEMGSTAGVVAAELALTVEDVPGIEYGRVWGRFNRVIRPDKHCGRRLAGNKLGTKAACAPGYGRPEEVASIAGRIELAVLSCVRARVHGHIVVVGSSREGDGVRHVVLVLFK